MLLMFTVYNTVPLKLSTSEAIALRRYTNVLLLLLQSCSKCYELSGH